MCAGPSVGRGLGGTVWRGDEVPEQVRELAPGPQCFPEESIQSLIGFPKGLCLNETLGTHL